MKFGSIFKIVAGAWLVAGGIADAESPEWQFEAVPSLWLAGLSGDGTLRGHAVEYDRSAGDLLDRLEVGGSLAAKAVFGPFAVGGQIDGYRLSTDDLKVDDRPLDGQMDTDMLFTELAAGYVIKGWKPGQTFTVALGARHAHVEGDLEIRDADRVHRDMDLLDPMVILWPSMPLFPSKIEGLSLAPAFSIGGGGDSELVYELFPQLRYQVSEQILVRFGYRSIGYRMEKGNDELDFDLAGFIAGVGATF